MTGTEKTVQFEMLRVAYKQTANQQQDSLCTDTPT